MVKTTGVTGPTLTRSATVSVLLSIGNTPARRVIFRGHVHLWCDPTLDRLATVSVWQRAVNRQHGSRANNS